MTAPIAGSYRIGIPVSGLPLPAPGGDVDQALDTVVASLQLEPRQATRMRDSLAAVTSFAHARPNPGRAYWALVEHPRTGNVDALLSLDVYSLRDGDGPENYEARLREGAGALGDAIRFDVERLEIAGRPAVLTYQLELPAGDQGLPAVEQATLAHFAEEGVMLEYRMIAQDLAAYDDIAAYLVQLATGLEVLEANGA